MPDGSDAIGPLLRRLPHNIDAEMAVLGGLIANSRVWEKVEDFLRPEHFVVRDHQRIYQEIAAMRSGGRIADPVTLKNLFERTRCCHQSE
jgi:replicative DNA helicase